MKRTDALANRQRILDAAKQVFADQGMSADMKDIAERADLGVGTIYRNFPGKDDLLIELCRGMAGEVAGALSEGEDQADPIAGLRMGLTNVYEVARKYGWLLHAKMSQQLPPDVQKTFKPPFQDARYQAVIRLIDRAKESGQIRADVDPNVLMLLLFATIWPMTHAPFNAGRSGAEVASTVLELVLRGAANQAA